MIQILDVELTQYRVPVYRRLQERLGEDVFVYHGQPRSSAGLRTVADDENVGFSSQYLRSSWILGRRILIRDLRPAARHEPRPRAVIVRPLLRDLALLPTMRRLRQRGTPVIGWGHAYSRRRAFQPDRRLLDRAYVALVSHFDAYICYTESIRAELAEHVDPNCLFVARNTPDTAEAVGLRRSLEAEGRSAVRRSLGLQRRVYLSFIGRLQARKRPDELLEVHARLVRDQGVDAGLLIIGDGPVRVELERQSARLGLPDVHFLGALYGQEAARYLFASDVMVMPGALGLAVPHAFALGVPVVSRYLGNGFVGHGPEASYIEHGVNGRFAATGGDADQLVAEVLQVLDRRGTYSRAAAAYVERHLTLDRMVDGFIQAIRYVTACSHPIRSYE